MAEAAAASPESGGAPPPPPPKLTGSLADALADQVPVAMAAADRQQKQLQSVTGSVIQRVERDETQKRNMQAPPLPPETKPPQVKQTSPAETFGSLAMMLAIFGSAFTRRPAINALNAGAAVNKAVRDNDLAAAKTAYDNWKAETDYALKRYQFEHETYRDSIDLLSSDQNTALANLRTYAAAFKDDPMKHLVEAGHIAEIVELQKSRKATAEKTAKEAAVLEEGAKEWERFKAAQQHFTEAQKSGDTAAQEAAKAEMESIKKESADRHAILQGKPPASAKGTLLYDDGNMDAQGRPTPYYHHEDNTSTTLTGEPYTPKGAVKKPESPNKGVQFNDSDVDYWASVLKSGGHLPPGLSRTQAGSVLVQRVMKKMGESGSPGDFIANSATVKADDRSLSNMTKMADAATSFERTASLNFDLALKLSKDAVPTDWGPFVNRWIMSGETQFGDTDVPPYVTAMLTGANEYAKIMSGSTGAQGSTVDSRREAAELFSPYLSKGQIERVVAVAKADMDNRKQSLYGQIDDIKARLHAAGSGEPTAAQGQQPAGAGIPLPPAFKLDPDGTGYSKDGKTWVKHGNRLIEAPGAEVTK